MNRGFTIKCNKCGKEQVLLDNDKDSFHKGIIEVFAPPVNDTEFYPEVEVHCDCGNTAYE